MTLENDNLGQSYMQNLKNIHKNGSVVYPRGGEILEILGSRITGKANKAQIIAIKDIRDLTEDNSESNYLPLEMFWYFSGSPNIEFIGKFASIWNTITNPDGTINSNYGYQVFYKIVKNSDGRSRYGWAIKSLMDDIDTRQAIIPYSDETVYYQGVKDFTCTQLQHFFIREKILHSIVYIRSSDSIYGLNFDIPFWSVVQQFMFYHLNRLKNGIISEIGNLQINIGSSHIYKKHFDLTKKMIEKWENCNENKCFADLSLKPLCIAHHQSDETMKTFLHSVIEEIKFFAEDKTKSLFDSLFFHNIKSRFDPEDEYQTLSFSIHYYAKALMRIYRLAHYSLNYEVLESSEYKNFWIKVTKSWFYHFFSLEK